MTTNTEVKYIVEVMRAAVECFDGATSSEISSLNEDAFAMGLLGQHIASMFHASFDEDTRACAKLLANLLVDSSITADDNPIDVLASLWREAGYELDEKSFDAAREELEDADEEQLRRIVNIFMRQTRKKLSDVTDEERERLHENVPEFPTHRRET